MANRGQMVELQDESGNAIGQSTGNPFYMQPVQNGAVNGSFNPTFVANTVGTAVNVSNSATAGASNSVSLPAAGGRLTWIAGFILSAPGGVAALVSGTLSISGIQNTINLDFSEVPGAPTYLQVQFNPPIPSSAQNTAIVLTLGAIASGSVTKLSAWGYQL